MEQHGHVRGFSTWINAREFVYAVLDNVFGLARNPVVVSQFIVLNEKCVHRAAFISNEAFPYPSMH